MSGCTCDASYPAAVRPGPVVCKFCAGPWLAGGRQVELSPAQASKLDAVLADGGLLAWVGVLHRIVCVPAAEVVAIPGKGRVARCYECDGGDDCGEPCLECDGTGYLVARACPRCGDAGMWQYIDGRAAMSCRRCSATWTAADPGWLAQRIPARLLTVA
jgi:hypothetical protein